MTATAITHHYQKVLDLSTRGKSLQRFTHQVQGAVSESGITTGLCTVFIRHTSASLIIQENADPDVLVDLESFLAKLVPEQAHYVHSTEGPDDMPAHIRSVLTSTSETIPVVNGRPALRHWHGIYLCEHRAQTLQRQVVIHVIGN
jgi:secondary thiamine-phosphate synthase enzyme